MAVARTISAALGADPQSRTLESQHVDTLLSFFFFFFFFFVKTKLKREKRKGRRGKRGEKRKGTNGELVDLGLLAKERTGHLEGNGGNDLVFEKKVAKLQRKRDVRALEGEHAVLDSLVTRKRVIVGVDDATSVRREGHVLAESVDLRETECRHLCVAVLLLLACWAASPLVCPAAAR